MTKQEKKGEKEIDEILQRTVCRVCSNNCEKGCCKACCLKYDVCGWIKSIKSKLTALIREEVLKEAREKIEKIKKEYMKQNYTVRAVEMIDKALELLK